MIKILGKVNVAVSQMHLQNFQCLLTSQKLKVSNKKKITKDENTSKGGIFQFLQANLLSDTSN